MALKPGLAATLARAPRIGDWLELKIDASGTRRWTVRTGKVEIGQGIHTALRQIAASALGEALDRVQVGPVTTAGSRDEGTTSGSRSIEEGGALIHGACCSLVAVLRERQADATVHGAELLAMATADDLSNPVDPVLVSAVFNGPWIDRDAAPADTMQKLLGRATYVQDLRIDGMRHARVLRGPWHRAVLRNAAQVQSLLPEAVQWFSDGDFIALLGDDEDRVVRAWTACRAAAQWSSTPLADIDPNDQAWLTRAPSETHVVLDQPANDPVLDLVSVAAEASTDTTRHEATYTRPYLAHASIGPSCALASRVDGRLDVWCHSQAIFALQAEIAGALGLPIEQVNVPHVQGSGCYGHNGADDVAFDAALLAWWLQQPVRVQWMREDEFSSAPFGPATVVKIAASIDARGRIGDWQFDSWGAGHHSRPGTPATPRLLGAWQREPAVVETMPGNLPMSAGGGAERNSVPLYAIDGVQVRVHRITAPPVRSSSLRALGALANVFAIESFIDELAERAGLDPLQLRLDHLDDERAADVLRDAVAHSPWSTWRAAPPANHGIGCALARYKGSAGWCAVVACVSAEAKIQVHDLYISVDVGTVVNPDSVRSQVEGGAVQATSWALTERLGFDAAGVATATWDSYPILRFSDAPAVHVNVLDRTGEPALGAGEIAQGPTAAAIANALAHALGVRVRDLPMTFERVAQAIGA